MGCGILQPLLQEHFLTRSRRHESLMGWLFAIPWVLGLLLFNLFPFVYSFGLSLTSFRIGYPTEFIWLGNYVEMFTDDPVFGNPLATRRTSWLSVCRWAS